MFQNLFRKEKYLDCYNLKHTIHFFYDNVRACCSNIPGPVFYENYDGSDINWDYIYNKRKQWIKNINSLFNKKTCPDECLNCFELSSMYSNSKVSDFPNIIKTVYFHNNMSCNAKCIYCTYSHIEKGYKYKVLPAIQSMINNKILEKNANIYMSGGEITISPEFEDLFSALYNYLDSKIEILTSGIKYSESIKEAFINNKCNIVISLDCADRELYRKIKRVDCFDKVVNNIKSYIAASDFARDNITLKYILCDEINDNKKSISDFIYLVKNIGVNNIRLDIDYEKYKYTKSLTVPNHYFDLYEYFNSLSNELGLNIKTNAQVNAVLNKKI